MFSEYLPLIPKLLLLLLSFLLKFLMYSLRAAFAVLQILVSVDFNNDIDGNTTFPS